MEHNHIAHSAFAPEAAYEPASPLNPQPAPARSGDLLDFDPVPLRYREDGLTPEKQREYVEALADCGIARHAAARIGVSEQAVNRVRRRADARSFDRACAAALRIGARRLVSVAFERAIEGTIKRHTYHGEIVSEERVYDNRLLMSLIGKLPDLFEPGADEVERDWQPWMEAIEQGLPEPAKPDPVLEPERGAEDWAEEQVWQEEDGIWWTCFPPPSGFDGEEEGVWNGRDWYCRSLTAAELAVIEAEAEAERLIETARRDLYFGFAGDEVFSPGGCETYEPSTRPAADGPAMDGLAEPSAGATHGEAAGSEP
jgi:hypothetical protein